MESLGFLLQGFLDAASGWNIIYCFIGVFVGMLVGVLPGIGPTSGTAILIPLTYGMNPTSAIIMLSGIYYGAMYGGTVTSVLINTPGESASVITCLDGYPLARQGRAGVALGIAAIGSFIGGVAALIGLIVIGPPIARMALKFGPPAIFCLILLSMTMVISLMGRSLVRGLISAVLGLTFSLVGIDISSSVPRYTLGIPGLFEGIDTVAMAMGLFGITEILMSVESPSPALALSKIKGLFPKKEEWAPCLKAIARGSGMGFLIGLLPGTNSVIPTMLSYTTEKKLAKDPSRFGKGALEGVAGPETANNSYCGGALIPLFTLGLPTSPAIAILLGAFIMHGLQPGPRLFSTNPQFVWAIIASMFIGNLLLLIMNLPLAGAWAKIAAVPQRILFPIILAVSIIGCYSLKGSMLDVEIMLLFGVVGYIFKKADIPLAPMILTFVLGAQMENSLVQSLTIFHGDITQFVQQPIPAALLGITAVVFTLSIVAGIRKKKDTFADDIEM
jgi:putative tricarboxylic transport membrane protein